MADEAFLRAKSPLFHASRIRRPLLVLQGANDRRVPPEESTEVVAAAWAAGAEVEYLLFEDEGHGFSKLENRLEAYRAMLAFLDKNLRLARTLGNTKILGIYSQRQDGAARPAVRTSLWFTNSWIPMSPSSLP